MLRTTRILIDGTAEVRYATLDGADHMVVPCIIAREGVIRAGGSPHPEFVPAKELARTAKSWNGRVITYDHPGGGGRSANNPSTIESVGFGQLFNAEMRGDALFAEAWINIAKARKVGAYEVVERIQARKAVDVSIGCDLMLVDTKGEYEGKKYQGVWTEIISDHLAMLPPHIAGACSNKMGCGALRAAHEGDDMCECGTGAPCTCHEPAPEKRTLAQRLGDMLRFRSSADYADMSDSDLRHAIATALRAEEPGFEGVHSVYSAANEVIYMCCPEDKYMLYRRSYKLKKGEVVLAAEKQQVEPVTRFEPVTATASTEEVVVPPVEAVVPAVPEPIVEDAPIEEDKDMNRVERIASLIASQDNDFTDADRPMLEAASDARLEQYAAQRTAAAPTPTPTPVPAPAAQPAAQVSLQQYLDSAPPEFREVIETGIRTAAAKKEHTIQLLLKSGKCDFPEQTLRTSSQQHLDALVKLAGVQPQPTAVPQPDFTLRSAAFNAAAGSTEENTIPAPPDIYASIRTAAAKK